MGDYRIPATVSELNELLAQGAATVERVTIGAIYFNTPAPFGRDDTLSCITTIEGAE